ncbi:hypothetical protein B0H16DRAFT_1495569 [Mycena metata]|uniref:F-box domain-containing protein n=1 Tax=Mycena metata TaxID=1033252 RepID=A0AAD7P0X3_9AGAR|nr:hypothetical protein B0H16DRAFT_1495569 [Mycena metata]
MRQALNHIQHVPLDVILLILRLVPLQDALAMFMTSKFFLSVSRLRPFWVYANIDVDVSQRTPGRQRTDYSRISLLGLQSRVLRYHNIFKAWRRAAIETTEVHTLPLSENVRQVIAVPWTKIALTVEDDGVHFRDWGLQRSHILPLRRPANMLIVRVDVRWVDTVGCNVVIVMLSNRGRRELLCTEIQFYRLNTDELTTSYLTAINLPYALASFSLADRHLAVIGHIAPRVHFIQSLRLSYEGRLPTSTTAVVIVGLQDKLSSSSFTILDDTRFLLANPTGITVYRFSERTLTHAGVHPKRIRPCWRHRYDTTEVLARPPIGPVLVTSGNERCVTVCGGRDIWRVFMADENPPRFRIVKIPLMLNFPRSFTITIGRQMGLCNQSFLPLCFLAFSLADDTSDSHPLGCLSPTAGRVLSRRIEGQGVISFALEKYDTIDPGSMSIDEGEGRVVLVVRSHARPRDRPPSPRLVIFDLVV